MKHRFLFFLSFMLLVTFSIKAQELTNWTVATSDLTIEQETDALLINDGSSSVKCTWTSTSNQDLNSDMFAVTADASYNYSVDVLDTDNAGKARLVIIFYDDTDAAVAYNYDGYSVDNTAYQTVSASGTVPSDATKALIRIRFYDDSDWDGDATVWIDNVVYSDGTNNLLNGSFEDWTFSSAPVISDITISPETPTESDAVSVGATITDDNSVASATLNWGTESGNLTNSINMTATGIGDAFVADDQIPAQTAGTTVYYEIVAEDGDATPNVTTSPEQSYTIPSGPATTTLPYIETFDADLGQIYTYSVSGDTKEWYFDTDRATMNGYNSGDVEEDWFILPGINFDSYDNEIMTFETAVQYGSDDVDNYFKLVYSTDYSGTGDPSSSTWTELTFTQATTSDMTPSGNIDLTGITGTSVYIALIYHYESGSYRKWSVDNISIAPVTAPIIEDIAINPTAPTSADDVIVSATITDDVSVAAANIYWSLNPGVTTADEAVAMAVTAGDTFAGTIPAQANGATVYYIIAANDGSKTETVSEEQSYTIIDPETTTLPYVETFDADLGQIYTYSVSGDTKEWYFDTDRATMNGYNSGEVEEDWFILPGINFDSYDNEIMTFETAVQYGSDDADNYLKLVYSTDYSGTGDPSSSTWTELTFTQATTSDMTPSGNIDLSGITGTSVYIALIYHYESGSYRKWSVDNISIAPVVLPTIEDIAINPTAPTSADDVIVSATITDDVAVTAANIYWSLNPGVTTADEAVAMAVTTGDTFAGTIPAQASGATVYYIIVASDGSKGDATSAEQSYIVSANTDATLSDLTVDGTTVDGFASDTYSYTVNLPEGTTDSPVVAGTASDSNATVTVAQATDVTSDNEADRTATVTVTAEDGSTQDYTVLFNVATTNVNDIFANSISIYPNPSNGMFNIVVKENFNIEVFDIAGKVLQTKNASSNLTINIPNAGVYFIRFSNEAGSTVKSVVVK